MHPKCGIFTTLEARQNISSWYLTIPHAHAHAWTHTHTHRKDQADSARDAGNLVGLVFLFINPGLNFTFLVFHSLVRLSETIPIKAKHFPVRAYCVGLMLAKKVHS
jgi:hypothetical protein